MGKIVLKLHSHPTRMAQTPFQRFSFIYFLEINIRYCNFTKNVCGTQHNAYYPDHNGGHEKKFPHLVSNVRVHHVSLFQ